MKKNPLLLFLFVVLSSLTVKADENATYWEMIYEEEKIILAQTISDKDDSDSDNSPEPPLPETTALSLIEPLRAEKEQIPEGVHLDMPENELVPDNHDQKGIPKNLRLDLPENEFISKEEATQEIIPEHVQLDLPDSELVQPLLDQELISEEIRLNFPDGQQFRLHTSQGIPKGTKVALPEFILNKYKEEKHLWDSLQHFLRSNYTLIGPPFTEGDQTLNTHYLALNLMKNSERTDTFTMMDFANLETVDEERGLYLTLFDMNVDKNRELTEYFLGLTAEIPF